jgi:hypothetical protein
VGTRGHIASPPAVAAHRSAQRDGFPAHDSSTLVHCDIIVRCPHTSLPVSTPLRPAGWLHLLRDYPDPDWAHRLVHDLIYGVDIGYRGARRIQVHSLNFVVGSEEAAAVTVDMAAEVGLGHIAGPYAVPPFPFFRCSPLKTVPKKGKASKFRIIHHLSHPHGHSINSFTADWPCVLAGFAAAVDIVRRLGRGCYMAKIDVKAAYRCIPVRPADWPLLGMRWEQQYYFHRTLPFGLRSACHLWERYATALEWIIRTAYHVVNLTHYVDDSFLANASLTGCVRDLAQAKSAMAALGVPDAPDKTEGPTTRMVYLGICIDSTTLTVSLDAQRVETILLLVSNWSQRTSCSLRQLQTTLGILEWASQVVRHGRTFLQHLRDLAAAHWDTPSPTSEVAIPIDEEVREDLLWWRDYLLQWNGISLLWENQWLERSSILQPHTDACVEGYAAVCDRQWFHGRWTSEQSLLAQDGAMGRDSMPWKELFAIVAAAATWGHLWERRKVIFVCDCMPVVQALSKGASRTRRMMQLIRVLHFYAARHHFVYKAEHIAGVDNIVADELSRVYDYAQLTPLCRSNIDLSPTIPVLPAIRN